MNLPGTLHRVFYIYGVEENETVNKSSDAEY